MKKSEIKSSFLLLVIMACLCVYWGRLIEYYSDVETQSVCPGHIFPNGTLNKEYYMAVDNRLFEYGFRFTIKHWLILKEDEAPSSNWFIPALNAFINKTLGGDWSCLIPDGELLHVKHNQLHVIDCGTEDVSVRASNGYQYYFRKGSLYRIERSDGRSVRVFSHGSKIDRVIEEGTGGTTLVEAKYNENGNPVEVRSDGRTVSLYWSNNEHLRMLSQVGMKFTFEYKVDLLSSVKLNGYVVDVLVWEQNTGANKEGSPWPYPVKLASDIDMVYSFSVSDRGYTIMAKPRYGGVLKYVFNPRRIREL